MITAVRLRAYDRRKGHRMRTYTSAATGTKYTAGTATSPSAFRVVRNKTELRELSEFPQFEILEFDDMDHLREVVQSEMESRARQGLPAVRAPIMGGPSGRSGATKHVRPSVSDRLPPAASGPVTDSNTTGKGRQPSTQVSEEGTRDDGEKGQDVDLDAMTKRELIAEAEERGVEVGVKMTKAQIREAIDGAQASGRSVRPADDE